MITSIYILISLYLLKVVVFYIFYRKQTLIKDNNIDCSSNQLTASIIIPMHNEEKVICKTVESLLNIERVEIILVDDGSTDNTVEVISTYVKNYKQIRLYKQKNQGKSAALNLGIKMAKHEIVICIDADTFVTPLSIYSLLDKFEEPGIAAVAGNLRGANLNNIITYMQDIEYVSIYNFERQIFSNANGITIIPGAIGAFRKDIIEKIGGYNLKSITEDIDLVQKLKISQYVIINSENSIGYTELPESIDMYIKQRIRWKTGLLLNTIGYLQNTIKNNLFSYTILPYLILFRLVIPIFLPLIDYMCIYAIFTCKIEYIVGYIFYIILDSCIIGYILCMQKHFKYILVVPLQRLMYRQLGGLINICILYLFITGNLLKWRRCKRYGTE